MARVKRRDGKRETAAHRAREYIDAHPSIRDCLQMDLINLSALSRKIVKETDVESEDAALIACRRYIVPPGYRAREAAVKGILRKSKIEIHSKVAIITVRPSYDIMRELALPTGPKVGQILNALFERVLDEPSLNTSEKLIELAKAMRP